MKSLVLAEKPSVGRDLARVLGCGRQQKGYFDGSKYVVTWALGHLVTLAEPELYDPRYKEWRMEDLPMLPDQMKLKVIGKTSHQFRTVTQLMKRNDVSEIIIATDAGREGELVARWIIKLAGCRKPIKRLWISSQTDQAIKEGFARLKPGREYENLFHAAVGRSEADWLIGLNISRALTCKYDLQLSAGRVQTPTLAMITQRDEERKRFEPKPFWTVTADLGRFTANWRAKDGNQRLFDRIRAEKIVAGIEGGTARITHIRKEDKSEPSPLAYDLTELQREANRRFGSTARHTLSTLQRLYEQYKIVTYPRTDSRYITTDVARTIPARLQAISVGPYQQLAQKIISQNPAPGPRLVNNSRVTDHHALLPTEIKPDLNRLSADERRLYDLIVRRFLAVLHPPFRFRQVTLEIEINGESFVARGREVIDKGWRIVTGAAAGDDALPEPALPSVENDARLDVRKALLKTAQTEPPPPYTEATLLTAMESPGKFIEDEELRESIKAGGLGTPATRAEIIEKLLSSHYIERQGKSLIPTSKGNQLVELVPEELRSPELTARWEQRLSDIAQGKEKSQNFIQDIRANAAQLVRLVRESKATLKLDNVTKTKCPICGRFMLRVKEKKDQLLVCPDRECGHRESEERDEMGWSKRSRRGGGVSRELKQMYGQEKSLGTSMGDLLAEAMKKKQKPK